MGPQAARAVLDAVFGVGEIAAAVFAQGVEGAVAEDAAEGFWVGVGVAGKVFTFPVLEEIVVWHGFTSLKLIPGEFIGWGSVEGQLLACPGMAEAEQGGPEGDFAVVFVGAVLSIPHQGQVSGGELAPDLMGAARDQADANLAQSIRFCQNLVVQDGLLDILAGFGDHIGLALKLVPQEQVCHTAGIILGDAVENGQVFLVEFVLPDLSGQLRGSFGGSGQDHQTRHHLVQPVDSADICVRVPQGSPAQLGHTTRLVGGANPGRLDADQNIPVTVENFKFGHGGTSQFHYLQFITAGVSLQWVAICGISAIIGLSFE